jgi:hypothetical protein
MVGRGGAGCGAREAEQPDGPPRRRGSARRRGRRIPAVLGSAWIDPPVVDAAGVVQPDDRRLVAVRLADGGEAVDAVCVWQAGRCVGSIGVRSRTRRFASRAQTSPISGSGCGSGASRSEGTRASSGPRRSGAALLVHDLGRGGGWGPVDVEVVSEGGGWARSGPLRPASDTFPVRVDAAVAGRVAVRDGGAGRAGGGRCSRIRSARWRGVAEAERRCGVDARAVSRAVCVSVKGGGGAERGLQPRHVARISSATAWFGGAATYRATRGTSVPGRRTRFRSALARCGSVPTGGWLAVRVWKCPQPYAGATEEALWTWRATRAARGEGDAPRYGATRIRFPAR